MPFLNKLNENISEEYAYLCVQQFSAIILRNRSIVNIITVPLLVCEIASDIKRRSGASDTVFL